MLTLHKITHNIIIESGRIQISGLATCQQRDTKAVSSCFLMKESAFLCADVIPLINQNQSDLVKHKLAGCMGRPHGLPASLCAGSLTPCSPLFVFSETTSGFSKHSNKEENPMKRNINPSSESPWFTLQEAADYVRLNKRTFANYVGKGLVPVHISLVGGKRFKKDELDSWISTTKRGFLPNAFIGGI